jgi:hypothetical protein
MKGNEILKVGIIDAEIIGKSKHRFPNLCSMKLSSYHKSVGDDVELLLSYDNLSAYDKVYISKVFTKTEVPNGVLDLGNVEHGGTGFFYDKAPPLPCEIEHAMPDYHLYDAWVESKMAEGVSRKEFVYYLDYSIGYLTRGCFRGCYYCVNRNCKRAYAASPLSEFMDPDRKKLCFLDDNFLSYPQWEELLQPVIESGKRFQFKQGLDERLLTKDKVLKMSNWKYDQDMIFAFDNIEDKDLIVSKLALIRTTVPDWSRRLKFYVFCGCDKNDVYDEAFWEQDIINLFERIFILKVFGCRPYIMRFEKVYDSEYSTFYSTVAAWCNQPAMFLSFTFREFAICASMRKNGYAKYKRDIAGYLNDIGLKGSKWRAMEMVENRFPDIGKRYFDFTGKQSSKDEWKSIYPV